MNGPLLYSFKFSRIPLQNACKTAERQGLTKLRFRQNNQNKRFAFKQINSLCARPFYELCSNPERQDDISNNLIKEDSIKQNEDSVIVKMKQSSFHFFDSLDVTINQSSILIDKSLILQEIINHRQAILLIRPRRFGKSFNLSIMYYFFNKFVDKNGEPDKKKNDYAKKVFQGGEIVNEFGKLCKLEAMQISENKQILEYHQNNYPVIHLDFKNIAGDSYEKIVQNIRAYISSVFIRYSYLTKSNKLNDHELVLFNKYVDEDVGEQKIIDSLRFLTQLLKIHFEKNVVVLVDEYDSIVNRLISNAINDEDMNVAKQVSRFLTKLFAACGKGNNSLYKIVMTGVLDILQKEGESGFNNVKTFYFNDTNFRYCYGLTEKEVNDLIKKRLDQNCENYKKSFDLIKRNIDLWYNGYCIPNSNQKLYNIYSVISYLENMKEDNAKSYLHPESFWTDSSTNKIFQKLISSRKTNKLLDSFTNLAIGNEVVLHPIKTPIIYKNFHNFLSDETIISHLLVNLGYVTPVPEKQNLFKTPNLEIREYFKKEILDYFRIKIPEEDMNDSMLKSFFMLDSKKLEQKLHDFLRLQQDPSDLPEPKEIEKTLEKKKENPDGDENMKENKNVKETQDELRVTLDKHFRTEKQYKLILLLYLTRILKTHSIKSEFPGGDGYNDIFVYSQEIQKDQNVKGMSFIFELKQVKRFDDKIKRNEELQKAIDIGTAQYKNKKYDTVFEQYSPNKHNIFMCIAFSGKYVKVHIDQTQAKGVIQKDAEWKYVKERQIDY